jgi:FKBP-type peptidyl-prolyl cis-trans isomerase
MNIKKLAIPLMLVPFVFGACNQNKSSVKLKNESDSISYCLGLTVGENLKHFDMPSLDVKTFGQAVYEVMHGKETKIKPENAGMYLQQYFTKLQMQQGAKNLKDGQDFLAKNKERKGVTTTPSGLQYEVIKQGTGPHPAKDDFVSIHYKGSLLDGTVFDNSYDRGQPASFSVGGVIPGFSEALQLMPVGSKYKVWIPAELGYGANGNPRGGIKPNSVLSFEIELLSIDSSTNKTK